MLKIIRFCKPLKLLLKLLPLLLSIAILAAVDAGGLRSWDRILAQGNGSRAPGSAAIERGSPPLQGEQGEYVTILFAGDTHFNWGVAAQKKKGGSFHLVRDFLPLFESVHFRVLNLETSISRGGSFFTKKSYIFNAGPQDIALLKRLRIDLALLGNNHSMDMGPKGLEDTRSLLRQQKIASIGAGRNIQEAQRAHRVRLGNIPFSLFSASYVGPKQIYSADGSPGVAPDISLSRLRQEARSGRNVIASLHWGREYYLEPTAHQIRRGRNFIKEGATVVIGHHPHIPQPIEIYRGGVICYSLGNFLFGSYNEMQDHNLIALLDFSRKSGQLEEIRLIPISGRYLETGHRVRFLQRHEGREFWKKYWLMVYEHSPATAERMRFRNGVISIALGKRAAR